MAALRNGSFEEPCLISGHDTLAAALLFVVGVLCIVNVALIKHT
jgi:hypothetical protein